jgi:hypothetical protein
MTAKYLIYKICCRYNQNITHSQQTFVFKRTLTENFLHTTEACNSCLESGILDSLVITKFLSKISTREYGAVYWFSESPRSFNSLVIQKNIELCEL